MKFARWLGRFIIGWAVIAVISIAISSVASLLWADGLDKLFIITTSLYIQAFLLFMAFIVHPAFSAAVARDKHLRWIRRFWDPHMVWLWVLLLLTLLSSGVALAFPLVFRYVIDFLHESIESSTEPSPDLIHSVTVKAIWIFIVIGLARTLTHLYPGFRAMLNAKIGMDVREHYFSVILSKGHKFFQKFRTGDLVTRLTDDIEQFPKIAWFCCSGIFRAAESSSKFLFCIIFMLFMNWKLALLTISPLPIMLILFYIVRMALTRASLANQQAISETSDSLEAAFSGVRIIKAFRAESNQAVTFRQLLDRRIKTELRLIRLWMGMMNIYMWIQHIGQVIVMVAGGAMVIAGTLSIGELYAFYVYLSLMMQPLMDIPHLFVASRQAFACIDREIEIGETPGGTEDKEAGHLKVDRFGAIKLDNVNFRFEEDLPPALDNVCLEIKRGEKAAVVGSVGSGKSTLIRVAAGLISPDEGNVTINERPIDDYIVHDIREHIGYIPQESTLFSESVAENVRFGRDIPEEDVRNSLDMAQVLEEMEQLPDGINEVLGQKGITVSGGQKQRIAIARALAGNPDLLLMDDCTSALDAENERRFWNMFTEKSPDSACLIVTHRLATARQADTIYVLDEGKIVGRGTHEELLRSCEEYQNFLSREELQAALKAS